MRILLIEDDIPTAQVVARMLGKDNTIDMIHNGREGLELGKIYDYDLIILDLGLPDVDGIKLLEKIRFEKINTPIIVLSGYTSTEDKIRALAWADDYMTKPYNNNELVARIRAVIRRSLGHASSVVNIGHLSINLDRANAFVAGKKIELTCKEYHVLELLALRSGMTVTKEMFLNHLYNNGHNDPELKIIDVFVCKLRKKLREAMVQSGLENYDYIKTEWGKGYTLSAPVQYEEHDGMSDDSAVADSAA